jgi:LacI family transcriptional regulator
MANLRDVAKRAGVSVATISRMLNGTLHPSDSTRSAINAAILELNYRPNPYARSLSRGRSDIVRMLVPDIKVPFFASLVAAVEDAAFARGQELALSVTLNRPGRELRYLDSVSARHVDGLIFVTNHSMTEQLVERITAGRRVVLLDEDVPGALAPRLFCDNLGGGQTAGRHLVEHGHARVAVIGPGDDMMSAKLRFEGFSSVLRAAWGVDAHIVRCSGQYTVEDGRRMCTEALDADPELTAIFAMSDEMVMGALEVLSARGLRVPDDISLVGFDDILPLHLFSTPVTSIRQPVDEMGRRALEVLLDTDWDDPEARTRVILVPVGLIERSSVASVSPPTAATAQQEKQS